MLLVGHTSGICRARRGGPAAPGPARRRPVPDPLGAEQGDRLPHGLRPGRLAGVRHRVQAGGTGSRESAVRTAPAAPRSRVRPGRTRPAPRGGGRGRTRRGIGGLQAGLAGDVVDPAEHDPVVALGRDTRVLDGLGVRLDGDAAHDRGVGRHRQLGVAHLLSGELPGHLVREHPHVLGGAQQADRREYTSMKCAKSVNVKKRTRAAGSRGTGLSGCRPASSATIRGEADPRGARAARPWAGQPPRRGGRLGLRRRRWSRPSVCRMPCRCRPPAGP